METKEQFGIIWSDNLYGFLPLNGELYTEGQWPCFPLVTGIFIPMPDSCPINHRAITITFGTFPSAFHTKVCGTERGKPKGRKSSFQLSLESIRS